MNLSLSLSLGSAALNTGGGWRPPFDLVPASFSAVGLCRLYTSYTGALVRLRRASDNAQQDFSAGVDGWLNPVEVATWAVGASSFALGDVFVVTRYDQFGSARPVTTATAANQARLSPHCRSLVLDGVNDLTSMTESLGYSRNRAGLTYGAVIKPTNKADTDALFQSNSSAGNTRFRVIRATPGGNFGVQSRQADGGGAASSFTPTDMGDIWNDAIASVDFVAAQYGLTLDGVTLTGAHGTTVAATTDADSNVLMGVDASPSATDFFTGEKAAEVWFTSALAGADRASLVTALRRIRAGVEDVA